MNAQTDTTIVPLAKEYKELELQGHYYFNANALTTQFVNMFYKGGIITNDIKKPSANRLAYSNYFGGDLNYGVIYRQKNDTVFGRSNLSFSIGLRDRTHLDGLFSKDFYNLIMYGNKPYAGHTLDLGSGAFNFLRYQQLQFGLKWENDSSRGDYGFNVAFLKGESNTQLQVPTTSFYTAPDGTFIDMSTSINARRTNPDKVGIGAFNGWGISSDLFYEIPYVLWKNDGVFVLEVADLGFINWNKQSKYYYTDTNYHFVGMEMNNILNLTNQSYTKFNKDSLIKNNFYVFDQGYTTVLPAIFTVSAATYYGKKIIIDKGISYRIKANCKPYYYVNVSYFIKSWFMVSGIAAYGGYGKFNAGAELELTVKKYKLHLDSYYLNGYLMPSRYSGQGVSINLSRQF